MKQLVLSEWLLTKLSDSPKVGQHHFPSRMPNHRRVYETIRRAITEQVLPSGSRLPSTRSLAEDLSVSRNTVLAAFDQLLDEGYVTAKTGSGTFVCYKQTELLFSQRENSTNGIHASLPQNMDGNIGLSKRGQAASESITDHEVQPFAPGEDDYSRFPISLWRRLLNRHWRALDPALLDSSHEGGYLPLRQAIADYLRVSRAVNLTVDQVLITSGTQQSIDLCARVC
jgi:GntR family transcriptional regulator / MocR family aminotransferase